MDSVFVTSINNHLSHDIWLLMGEVYKVHGDEANLNQMGGKFRVTCIPEGLADKIRVNHTISYFAFESFCSWQKIAFSCCIIVLALLLLFFVFLRAKASRIII